MRTMTDPMARFGTGSGQGTLFQLPPASPKLVYNGEAPAASGSDTSTAAAECQRTKAPSIRQQLLIWIRARGEQGATAEEAGEFLASLRGMPNDNPACRLSAAARLCELKAASFLKDSGRRRQTRAGCGAAVLVATDKAGDGSVCEEAP